MRIVLFLSLLLAGMAVACADVAYSALARYWTPDGLHVPYRAMATPGRIDGEKLPLIVFLHGDWQDGTNNESQLAGYGNGSMLWLDQAIRGNIPLVYVAPQTIGAYWPPARVAAVVHDALKRFPIDPRRIYLTGISDGGTGVWDAFKTWPMCFAAGVPMSGMTELTGLASIRDIPEWIFHGAKDNDTDVETGYGGAMAGSRAVVRALRELGGHPIYTEYPNEMHVIWHHAYSTPALLPWLLDQRLEYPPCNFSDLPKPGSLTWKGWKR